MLTDREKKTGKKAPASTKPSPLAETESKRFKEKYESVIRNIPDTIYSGLPDKTCSMTFISDRYTDWTGYSPEDFYKDPGLWPKTVHPEDREEAVDAWSTTTNTGWSIRTPDRYAG